MADIAQLRVVVGADTSQAEAGLASLGQKVGGVGSAIQTALGAAAVGAVAGLGAAFVGSVKAATDFEKGISAISAVSGEGADAIEGIRKTALQLGKDTAFSATEAAAGMEELVKAGLPLEQVMQGGARAVLDLAAASATAVPEAAAIMSNAMNVFKDSGLNAQEAANILAGAANASATSVHELGYGLAAAGNVASMIGFTFEETAAALALLADAGIKGSDAGTSFKTMMMNLIPTTNKEKDLMRELGLVTSDVGRGLEGAAKMGLKPMTQDMAGLSEAMRKHLGLAEDVSKWTKNDRAAWEQLSTSIGLTRNEFFNLDGTVKPLGEVFETLKTALSGMNREQQITAIMTIFGTDATRAATIANKLGAEGVAEMTEKMRKQGDVQKIANERMNNLWGSLEKLKGSLETGAIMLGSLFLPALKKMVDGLTEGVNQGIEIIEQLPDAWRTLKQAIEGGWEPDKSLAPFINAVGKLGLTIKTMVDTARPYFERFGEVVKTALSGDIQGAIDKFIISLQLTRQQLGPILAGWGRAFWEWAQAVAPPLLAEVGRIAVRLGDWIVQAAGAIASQLLTWATAFVAWVTPLIGPLLSALAGVISGLIGWVAQQVPVIAAKLGEWGATFVAWVAPQIPPLIAALGGLLTALGAWITDVALPALTAKLSEWGAAFVAWVGPTMEEMKATLATQTSTMWAEIEAIYVNARATISAKMAEANTYDEEQHRSSLERIKQAAVDAWGWYVAEQTKFSTSMMGEYQRLFAAIVTMHTKFFDDIINGLPQRMGQWLEVQRGVLAAAEQVYQTAFSALIRVHEQFWNAVTLGFEMMAENVRRQVDALIGWLTSIRIPMPSFGGGGGGSVGGGWTPMSLMTGGGGGGDVAAYIQQVGRARGWDEESIRWALAVAEGESGFRPDAWGDRSIGGSHGPFQLFMGGGLGNAALAQGIDPRDPSTWRQQVEFAMAHAEANGWGAWTVGRNIGAPRPRKGGGGIGMFKVGGGGGAPPTGTGRELPDFMNETWENLQPYEQSLDELLAHSHATYTGITEVAKEQGLKLAGSQTDALGNVLRVYQTAGGDIISTTTDTQGNVLSQYATMADGTTQEFTAMAEGVSVQTAQIGNNIKTTATDAAGNYVTTITDMSGQIVSQYASLGGQMASTSAATAGTVQQSYDLMATGATASVSQLSTGTVTALQDTAGNYITTVTGASGQILDLYGTLATGATVHMQDMGVKTTTAVNEAAGTITTTMTTLSGAVIATTTDMNGQVLAQTVTTSEAMKTTWVETSAAIQAVAAEMGARVMGESRVMGEHIVTTMKDKTGEMVQVVTDAAGNVVKTFKNMADSTGKVVANGLDLARKGFDALTKSMKRAEDQAEDTRSALERLGGAQGGSSGSKGKGRKGTGGDALPWSSAFVNVGETYLVDDRPSRSGVLAPAFASAGRLDTVALDLRIDGRTAERIYVEGKQLAIRRGRDS